MAAIKNHGGIRQQQLRDGRKRNMILSQWWEGVRLWYSDQDYLSAMDAFRDAVDQIDWHEADGDSDNHQTLPTTFTGPCGKPSSNDATDGSLLLEVTPLLLFLAGCYLDACQAVRARTLCRRCLWVLANDNKAAAGSCRNNNSKELTHSVVAEYIATFQEDADNVREPWNIARAVVEWAIQHQLTKWKADPYHRPGFCYEPLLPLQQPVYEESQQPLWCRQLEEAYPVIRDEYQALLRTRSHDSGTQNSRMPTHWPQVGAGEHREGSGQHDASVVQQGDWREVVLVGTGARPELAPRTCALLERIAPQAVRLAREGAGECIISVLAPHTSIAPHCASTNLRLTAHLGLEIPKSNIKQKNCLLNNPRTKDFTTTTETTSSEDTNNDGDNTDDDDNDLCYLQVAQHRLHWREGKVLVFDDSFQHEVHNNSDQIRAVLLLRFWHPDLAPHDQTKALQYVLDVKEKDRLQRCNPPLPHHLGHGGRLARGMHQTQCEYCGRSGHESVHLVDWSNNSNNSTAIFACVCGHEIIH